MIKIILFSFITTWMHPQLQQQTNDSTAIKQLLEKESATWRNGDIKAHADCWHLQPYSKILVSTAEGATIDIPPSSIIDPSPTVMGNGGYSINSNYKFSINGNNAWVSHNEESTDKNGDKKFSHEIRILEKINGHWKLVGEVIDMYTPK